MATPVWIGLLGSLRLRVDGAAVPLPAARQRAVLAVLAARSGELVPTDELAETVWDGQPPDRAAATLRNYVKRLRSRLGPAGSRIVTCRPGYRLEVAEDDLDLLLFARLGRDGGVALRAGDWAAAFGKLGQALRLWRGAPFGDTGCEPLLREQAPPLVELRLQAAEGRAEAGLALGNHAELVSELAGWCAAEPLRERFAALRMLALYRSGRQGDALAAYQQTRRTLVDELGVEPGEELQRLHQQILTRDPRLAAPTGGGAVPGHEQALAWFEAEHHVLLAVAALAGETGFDRHAWQLPWAIWDYQDNRGHWDQLATLQRGALAAATRLGDTAGQAAAQRALAGAYAKLANHDVAHEYLESSLTLYRQLGNRGGQARMHLILGWVLSCEERYAEGLGHAELALDLLPDAGYRSRALHLIGRCCAHLGRHERARASCKLALALAQEIGHRPYEAESWHNLGLAEHYAGDLAAATACYQRSLALFGEFGDLGMQATVLVHLGDTHHAAGQTVAARGSWHEAMAILDTLHHPDAGQVRAKLGLDGADDHAACQSPGTAAS